MTQSLNKPFTLHLSNVRGRKTNTSYPYEAPIICLDDLTKAAKFDHTAGLFKDGKNSKGGMITAHRAIKDFLERTDTALDDYDCIALHQANKFIHKQLSKKLKVIKKGPNNTISSYPTTPITSKPVLYVERLTHP